MNENELAEVVIGLCIKVHKKLGPGLLESVYERGLCFELEKVRIPYERQKPIEVQYEGVNMDVGFRADVIVADKLLLELKSTENVNGVHLKVLLTHLKAANIKLGLLINFRHSVLKAGINRVVNNL